MNTNTTQGPAKAMNKFFQDSLSEIRKVAEDLHFMARVTSQHGMTESALTVRFNNHPIFTIHDFCGNSREYGVGNHVAYFSGLTEITRIPTPTPQDVANEFRKRVVDLGL